MIPKQLFQCIISELNYFTEIYTDSSKWKTCTGSSKDTDSMIKLPNLNSIYTQSNGNITNILYPNSI